DDYKRNLGRTSYNNNLSNEQASGGEFGAGTALPTWIDFMQATALSNPVVSIDPPNNISMARIDSKSGLLTYQTDYTSLFEYFKEGTVPTEYVNEVVDFETSTYSSGSQSTPGNAPVSHDDLF
ncbi:MAG: penicillin-sensitive transpeptidase, partial [Psychromonas sp.]